MSEIIIIIMRHTRYYTKSFYQTCREYLTKKFRPPPPHWKINVVCVFRFILLPGWIRRCCHRPGRGRRWRHNPWANTNWSCRDESTIWWAQKKMAAIDWAALTAIYSSGRHCRPLPRSSECWTVSRRQRRAKLTTAESWDLLFISVGEIILKN